MTAEPSPRPWRVEASTSQGKFWICRTTLGVSIGETWKESDAALIVAAVNERDRLRDLVKRLARVAQDALDFANALSGIIPDNPEREKARNEIAEILAEARAAIGEDTP